MLKRTTTLCAALAVVLVSVGVAQAQTSWSENFESTTGNIVDNYGWAPYGLPDGANFVDNTGSLNGTNTAQSNGSNAVAHGVDFTGQDLVFFEFDAMFGQGDDWAGLWDDFACCNDNGIMVGGSNDFGGTFGASYAFNWPTSSGGSRTTFNNARVDPAHYRMEYDRSGATAEMRFIMTEIGNPSNVLDSFTQSVDASETDNIERLTHFYIQFRPSNPNESGIDNIVVGVPEPSTLALFGLGAMGLVSFFGRRRLRK